MHRPGDAWPSPCQNWHTAACRLHASRDSTLAYEVCHPSGKYERHRLAPTLAEVETVALLRALLETAGWEAESLGAAKTDEPVQKGLVAVLGSVTDTLIVCSSTALTILCTQRWRDTERGRVTVTAATFEQALPGIGI